VLLVGQDPIELKLHGILGRGLLWTGGGEEAVMTTPRFAWWWG
jgi:hypothetical protein